jgi:hypothetical protein
MLDCTVVNTPRNNNRKGRTVRKLLVSCGGIILAIGSDARENVEAISWLGEK